MLQQLKSFVLPEPDESWKFKIREIPQYTPDIAKLEQYESQLLFVADNCMKGHKKHELLVDDASLSHGHAYTKATFSMWKKELGEESYPVILKEDAFPHDWRGPKPGAPAQIYGELYQIPPRVLYKLDIDKLNTVQFLRRRIKLEYVYFAHIERPWFKENSKWNEGALSRAERELNNPEEAERLEIGPLYHTVTAWMYFGNPEYWNPQVYADWPEDGFIQQLFKPVPLLKNKEERYYYNYTRNENP